MELGKTIQKKRKAQGLTQAELAIPLNVSAAAISKWEQGASFPDVHLLSLLARQLKCDVNELLSFQAKCSRREIGQKVQDLEIKRRKDSSRVFFDESLRLLGEFPEDVECILSLGQYLLGAVMLSDLSTEEKSLVKEEIVKHLEKVASEESQGSRKAMALLVKIFMGEGKTERVDALLEKFPEEEALDIFLLKAEHLMKKEAWSEAARFLEESLVREVIKLEQLLQMLLDVALKEERAQDAHAICEILSQFSDSFSLWRGSSMTASISYFIRTKNVRETMDWMERFLAEDIFQEKESPLYRHLTRKKNASEEAPYLLREMVKQVEMDEDLEFLRQDPDYPGFLRRIKERMK